MLTRTAWIPALVACAMMAPAATALAETPAANIALADAKWQALVPQLGDKGPQLTVVFGDIKKGPVGLVLKFPAGFTPGPHTHSSDYWGVVISGEMVDTDPGKLDTATRLTAGGRWSEPANRPHDNLCTPKSDCMAFVYFPHGLDVKPIKK